MKKILFLLLSISVCSQLGHAQTLRYLNKVHKPIAEYYYHPANNNLEIGGITYNNGFSLSHSPSNDTHGWVEFSLKGKYKTLTFICGSADYWDHVGILAIRGDGRKLFETKVRGISTPERISVDITGVDILRFETLYDDVEIGVAEPLLWTASETPKETGTLTKATGKPIMLVRDLLPFYLTVFHNCIYKGNAPANTNLFKKFIEPVKVNGITYDYGISMTANMQLIGSDERRTFFNIGKKYQTLEFIAGSQDSDDGVKGVAWLTVRGDGKILLEEEIKQGELAKKFTLDVSGVHMLSFDSQQEERSSELAAVNIMLYPAGHNIEETTPEGSTLEASDKLKALPNVCKLISNIPPYAVGGGISREDMVYDGKSDFITFSMGGIKYNEGLVMKSSTHIFDDNTHCKAFFDLGKQFDYISFTTGWISKCGVLKNDILRVYADDQLVYETRLIATMPNEHHVVKINKCQKLMFEEVGMSTMSPPVWGVADIVVYRGEPVENNLFEHPTPECPSEIDLIDLGAPYIHYLSGSSSGGFVDGTSKKNYFTRYDNSKIYKGFVLQTSTHFSLEDGVLSGSDAVGASTVGAAAVGAAFVPIGVSVGGTVVGSTLMGVAGLMMLAAGGEAVENSCAAFNTYRQYNSVTFTVECLRTEGDMQLLGPDTWQPDISERKEKLLIGADHIVMAELAVFEGMKPQTVTVPINGCEQLMFWLANTKGTSAAYVFHDIKISKQKCELAIPEDMRPANAVVTTPGWTELTIPEGWECPRSTGVKAFDSYMVGVRNLYWKAQDLIKKGKPVYNIHTYYLETEAKQICKAVKLISEDGSDNRIPYTHKDYMYIIDNLREMKETCVELTIMQVNAATSLVEMGFAAVAYGKHLKEANKLFKHLKVVIDDMYKYAIENEAVLHDVITHAIDIDGRTSTERTIFTPLIKGEKVPEGAKAKVRNFSE